MQRAIIITLAFYLLNVSWVMAATPAMVERHIFAPEPDEKETPKKSPASRKLEKEFSFTGVIITPKGKLAMIQDARRRGNDGMKAIYKEGDEIKGFVIKEIGRNYVILTESARDVRLNLYYGGKSRPAPPPEPKEIPVAADENMAGSTPAAPKPQAGTQQKTPAQARPGAQTGATPSDAGETGTAATAAQPTPPPSNNPFAEALRKAMEKRKAQHNPVPAANNPLLEALRRAQGK